ncbi:MAG: transmembrane domain-containing protein, partial [Actinomycetota bacterium]|nr:transmembrane domain-containing protein [Actinomycetota bacterium]
MNTPIIIGIVIAVLVLIALVAGGVALSRRRRISLSDDSGAQGAVDGTTRQVDKSGGYKAGSGFSFSQGGGVGLAEPPEPTAPTEPATPAAPVPPTERTEVDGQPGVGDDASVPRDSAQRGIQDVALPADEDTAVVDDPAVVDDTAVADDTAVVDDTAVETPEAAQAPAAPPRTPDTVEVPESPAELFEAPAPDADTLPDTIPAETEPETES